ncbi:MAG: S-methyl-5-thioribose-1-phosphate isomerase, partial [Desulfurivibrionaceae bacterium]
MKINNIDYRTIWPDPADRKIIKIIDQRHLPHRLVIEDLKNVDDFARAIVEMHVRGAGLIGATAGFAMYSAILGADSDNVDKVLREAADKLIANRPTAANLAWAVNRQLAAVQNGDDLAAQTGIIFENAMRIADQDAEYCRRLGEHGLEIIREISRKKKGEPVNILTHCNAGWLATVAHGTATAPVYMAHDEGIPVHVWVD